METTSDQASMSQQIRLDAISLGFDAVGMTAVGPSEHAQYYAAWLAAGRHGSMSWLAREDAVRARADARHAWPGVRSAVVVALHYDSDDAGADALDSGDVGIIARYARGRDYHRVLKNKLLLLLARIEEMTGRDLPLARAYVDTGPVLERELARRAGLGWYGRNTMLIHPRRGSYFFLGTILLDIDLEYDEPFAADHCGTCSNCVTACPTNALLGRDESGAPVMDATRCISYLTIENRAEIPTALRASIGNRIFGCDICNEVCPFTRKFSIAANDPSFAARAPGEPPYAVERMPADGVHPGTHKPALVDLMAMDERGWEAFSRGSPLRRAGRSGFRRNVAVALGNWGGEAAVPVLATALKDPDPLVRGHVVWALARIGTMAASGALHALAEVEEDSFVRAELDAAGIRPSPTPAPALGCADEHPDYSTPA